LWDGLPPVIAFIFSPGLDVLVAQTGIALLGIFILWLRYREALQQQQAQLADQLNSFSWREPEEMPWQ
jgi:hypothetical protein